MNTREGCRRLFLTAVIAVSLVSVSRSYGQTSFSFVRGTDASEKVSSFFSAVTQSVLDLDRRASNRMAEYSDPLLAKAVAAPVANFDYVRMLDWVAAGAFRRIGKDDRGDLNLFSRGQSENDAGVFPVHFLTHGAEVSSDFAGTSLIESLQSRLAESRPVVSSTAIVPEPATNGLIAAAALIALAFGRRQKFTRRRTH